MTPHQHISAQRQMITKAALRDCGCSPVTAEAILAAASHPDTAAQVIQLNLDHARTTADQAALLGAMAFIRGLDKATTMAQLAHWAEQHQIDLYSDRKGGIQIRTSPSRAVAG
jgi:hypothetical protein